MSLLIDQRQRHLPGIGAGMMFFARQIALQMDLAASARVEHAIAVTAALASRVETLERKLVSGAVVQRDLMRGIQRISGVRRAGDMGMAALAV